MRPWKLSFVIVTLFAWSLASANFVYLEKKPSDEKTVQFFSHLNEILKLHAAGGGETIVVRYLNQTSTPFDGIKAVNQDFEKLEPEIANGTKDLGRERVFVWVQKSAHLGFVGADYGLDYVLSADFLEQTRDDILMKYLDDAKPLRAILETVKAILIQLDSPVLLPENEAVQTSISQLESLAEPADVRRPISAFLVFFPLFLGIFLFGLVVYTLIRTEIHLTAEGFSKKHVVRTWIDRFKLRRNQIGVGNRGEASGSW